MPQIEVCYYFNHLIHTPRYRKMGAWKMAILTEGAVEGKNQEVNNYGSYFNETVT